MTIAACHVSPEGVVLGADSTTTLTRRNGESCYFDNAQKLFEVGPRGSTVGLVTWGAGQLAEKSHRLIAHEIGAQAEARSTIEEFATSLADVIKAELEGSPDYGRARDLTTRENLSEDELDELPFLRAAFEGGYCLGGRLAGDGICRAFQIEWRPDADPSISEVPQEHPIFWGVPIFMERLIYGLDSQGLAAIVESGHWRGTQDELLELVVSNGELIQPVHLPLREAIDWIHTVIHTTIRAVKFAQMRHICGGPIEVAAITCDRPFRWVRHKPLDTAVRPLIDPKEVQP